MELFRIFFNMRTGSKYIRSFFASYLNEKITMSFYRPYHPIHFALQILKKGPIKQKLHF